MKSGLILMAVAGMLFAITAGLSLWLNPPKTEDPPPTTKRESKGSGNRPAKSRDDEPKPPTPPTYPGDPGSFSIPSPGNRDPLLNREHELDQKTAMHQFLVDDVRNEMEDLQKLFQLSADRKRPPDPPVNNVPPKPPTADPKPKPSTPENAKTGNNRLIAGLWESMAPETAARRLEQMVQSGKVDSAVQVLAGMTQAKSSKVLAAFTDEKVSNELIEKLTEYLRSAPTPTKP